MSLSAIAGAFVLYQVVTRTGTGPSSPGRTDHREPDRESQPHTESGRRSDTGAKQTETARSTSDPRDEDHPDLQSNSLLRQLEAARESDDPQMRAVFLTLLTKLVENDPTAAARFAESLVDGPVRSEALVRVTQNWAEKDPASSEAWAAQLANRNERQAALSNVCFKVSETDPAQAVQMAVSHQLETAPGVLENLVSHWANQDFSEAVAWARSQRSGDRRDQIFERLGAIRSAAAPAEAAKLVADEIAPGPVQDSAVVSVLTMWAMRDATSAQAWVDQFPSGLLKNRANDLLARAASADQVRK